MPMIRETIVTTIDGEGRVHIAPLGIIADGGRWILAPFRPSKTLDNLRAVPFAVANHTDDVRIYAGCLTGRRDWATVACEETPAPRLKDCLAHMSLRVVDVGEDEMRPRFRCEVVRSVSHAPFAGFNRAQAAVIEAAILASRLHLLAARQDRTRDRGARNRGRKDGGSERANGLGLAAQQVRRPLRRDRRWDVVVRAVETSGANRRAATISRIANLAPSARRIAGHLEHPQHRAATGRRLGSAPLARNGAPLQAFRGSNAKLFRYYVATVQSIFPAPLPPITEDN